MLDSYFDIDTDPQHPPKGNIETNLSIEYGFPSRICLMGILHIHLKIYLPECTKALIFRLASWLHGLRMPIMAVGIGIILMIHSKH